MIFNTCQVENGKVIYEVSPQTTTAAGKVLCEICLYGAEDTRLTSAAFEIAVQEKVCSDEDVVASATEATDLQKILSLAQDIKEDGALKLNRLETDRLDALGAYLDDVEIYKMKATRAEIGNMPFSLKWGTDQSPIVLQTLPRGVYYLGGVGKALATDTPETMETGVYFVEPGETTVVFAVPMAEQTGLTRYVMTGDNISKRVFSWEYAPTAEDLQEVRNRLAALEQAMGANQG